MKKSYDLIIFDCDGTLVDSERLIYKATIQTLNDLSWDTGFMVHKYWEIYNGLDITEAAQVLAYDLGILRQDAENIIKKVYLKVYEIIDKELEPIMGAYEVLKQINNKCIASNSFKDFVLRALQSTNLYTLFNERTIFTRELVTTPKPDPDIFIHAAHNMSVEPDRCLIVEDSLTGVKAAKSAGIDVLVLENSSNNVNLELTNLKPLAVIPGLNEVLRYI